jgi:hypothetical protein
MENLKLNFSSVKVGNYRFEIYEEIVELSSGNIKKYLAKKFLMTPKGKYQKEKCLFFFGFKEESARDEKVSKEIDNITANLITLENEKAQKKEAQKNLVNPFKVGSLFYDSWGYDQTNIDFFQVVEVKPKSLVLRKISQIQTESAGFMCEYVVANPDSFIGEPFVRPLKVSSNGKSVGVNAERSSRGLLFEYHGQPKYQSHYA